MKLLWGYRHLSKQRFQLYPVVCALHDPEIAVAYPADQLQLRMLVNRQVKSFPLALQEYVFSAHAVNH